MPWFPILRKTVEKVSRLDGFRLSDLASGSQIVLNTETGPYTLHVVDPKERWVTLEHNGFSSAGHYRLGGATFGGSIASGWVKQGMYLELYWKTPSGRWWDMVPESALEELLKQPSFPTEVRLGPVQSFEVYDPDGRVLRVGYDKN
ncbi:hypothetical protein J4453_02920 [Candidatus Woesearchaeota archaeon]|nr:hypothetical protein [Candidatus Woesearchaeota archaeon]